MLLQLLGFLLVFCVFSGCCKVFWGGACCYAVARMFLGLFTVGVLGSCLDEWLIGIVFTVSELLTRQLLIWFCGCYAFWCFDAC